MAYTWHVLGSGLTGSGKFTLSATANGLTVDVSTVPAWIPAEPGYYPRYGYLGWVAFVAYTRCCPRIKLEHLLTYINPLPVNLTEVEYYFPPGVVATVSQQTTP